MADARIGAVIRGCASFEAISRAAGRVSRRVYKRLERSARTSLELHLRSERRDHHIASGRRFRFHRQPREVSSRAADQPCLVTGCLEENRRTGGIRRVLRTTRQLELSPGPERSLQYGLRSEEYPVFKHYSERDLPRFQSDSQRRAAGLTHSYGGIVVVEGRATNYSEHFVGCQLRG